MKHNDKNRGWVDVDKEKKSQGERATFEVDGESYTPYAISQTYRFPLWLKACLAKWWFPGMVYYFIFFGFSGGITNQDILVLILGLVWGIVNDVFLNHYFRDFSSPNHDYTKYILCGRKSRIFISLPINMAIGVALSFLSAFFISIIIHLLYTADIVLNTDEFMFAVGPLLFATFGLIFDLLFCLIRNLTEKLIKKIKTAKIPSTTEVKAEVSNEAESEQILDSASNLEDNQEKSKT